MSEKNSRRGFIKTAAVALAGGPAVLAVSGGAARTDPLQPGRRRTYVALTEAVAHLRTAGDVGQAERRLAARYAASAAHERAEIDAALDAVGDLSAHPVQHRSKVLAPHLSGPYGQRITAAIGLAVIGLSGSDQRDVVAAGRLYARTIGALHAESSPAMKLTAATTRMPCTPPATK